MIHALDIGDSIKEGYNDNQGTMTAVVSCWGLPGRATEVSMRAVTPGSNSWIHTNLGQSGYQVAQYLKRAKGVIDADPTKWTVALVSSWSPNIPVGEDAWYSVDPAVLAANKAELIAMEAYCLARSVLFIPEFLFPSPFNLSAGHLTTLFNHIADLKTTWPHFIDSFWGSSLQTSGITDRYAPVVGASGDATHPTPAAYAALSVRRQTLLPAAYAAARAHYGF